MKKKSTKKFIENTSFYICVVYKLPGTVQELNKH